MDSNAQRESEGSFQLGNFPKEIDDLKAVIQLFTAANRGVSAIIGHSKGKVLYCVTEESLMEWMNTNMYEACLKVDQDCRVLTVHGSVEEVFPVEDAMEFAKIIPNHELRIIEGANHGYSNKRDKLAYVVLSFIMANMHKVLTFEEPFCVL